jgi:two-component system CAI-1 autoinducer sensor kinase/phosphatase CqsS
MRLIGELLERYRAYHRAEPVMIWYAGLLGAVAFPLFYLARFSRQGLGYDDLHLRLAAAGLCLLLILRKHWPKRLQPYFYEYSYAVLIFLLPFMFMFTALKNGGDTAGVASTLMAVFFVIFMTDWRNMLVMVGIGFAAAMGTYWLTEPDPTISADYLGRLPTLLLVMAGGSLFKLAMERATASMVRSAYASIAGSIAHEMRNPLAQISHSLEQLEEVLPAPGVAEQAMGPRQLDAIYRHVSEGERAVQRGLQVIAMTLDEVHGRTADQASMTLLSAATIVHKAVREFVFDNDEARERVTVNVQEDFVFRAEETSCLFVLFNLIKNALYYAATSPQLRVTLSVGGHTIRVMDTGPGIPETQLRTLFEPFRSVGKTGGTGLGLSYCLRAMRAVGGSITCESRPGEFTEFTLAFPEVPAELQEQHRQLLVDWLKGALAGKRVLVVDDDPAQCKAALRKLAGMGAVVDEAVDGPAALQLLATRRYEVVLMDIRMPGIDGYSVAEKLRRDGVSLNPAVRVLAHSSEPEHLARVKAQKVGMDGFLPKPCSQLAMLEALAQVIRAPRHRSVTAVTRPLAGRTVIVADDSAGNRRVVSAYLTAAGATVVETSGGNEAIQAMRTRPADAMVIDVHMPVLGGLETVAAIRASRTRWSGVPIVVLTGRSDQGTRREAEQVGVDAFLVKPVESGALCDTLEALLKRAGGQAPAAAGLLDESRLEGYRRLDMLDEVLADYVPRLEELSRAFGDAVRGRQLETAADVLHSLLGASGEAGAAALHEEVRRVYVPIVESGQWPDGLDWLAHIDDLLASSVIALRAYGAGHRPVAAAS